jgi:hypothetical protein
VNINELSRGGKVPIVNVTRVFFGQRFKKHVGRSTKIEFKQKK